MTKNGTSSADHDLRALAARFAHWRRTRAVPHERIPAGLWDQAATLSTVLPLSRVAQTLRLSRGALKAHRAATGKARALPPVPSAARGFVEVTAAPAWPGGPSGVEVEVRRPDGTQLRIHYHEAVPSLTAFVRGLLGEDACCN
jgi:hypothetical protein